jgi:hypothetical protein
MAASKASTIAAIVSGPNTPGLIKERIGRPKCEVERVDSRGCAQSLPHHRHTIKKAIAPTVAISTATVSSVIRSMGRRFRSSGAGVNGWSVSKATLGAIYWPAPVRRMGRPGQSNKGATNLQRLAPALALRPHPLIEPALDRLTLPWSPMVDALPSASERIVLVAGLERFVSRH